VTAGRQSERDVARQQRSGIRELNQGAPRGWRLTVVEVPLGVFKGLPLPSMKLTGKDTGLAPVLVK